MFLKKINMHLVSGVLAVVLMAIITSPVQATPSPDVFVSHNLPDVTPRDIMLVIDTTLYMAYATDGNPVSITDDPASCNVSHTCQPMETIKSAAIDYLDLLSFPSDRVGIVTMTSQMPGGTREPVVVLPLTNDKTAIQTALSNLKVFQPPVCVRDAVVIGKWISPSKGICLDYDSYGNYLGTNSPVLRGGADLNENTIADNLHDPTTIGSNNIGGALNYANDVLEQSARDNSSLVVILLDGGPANATSTDDVINHPDGFCPQDTWNAADTDTPKCRDNDLQTPFTDGPALITRHSYGDPNYDADDYARDAADSLAAQQAGIDITVHTIGVGIATGLPNQIRHASIGLPTSGENLLIYIANQTNGGQYYYAEDPVNLPSIFANIAGVVTDPNGRYVSPTGSDTSPTTCNSPLAPCLTINKAVQNAIAGNTIYVAEGTYTSASGTYVVTLNKSLTLSGGWDNAYANQTGFSTIDGQNTRQGVLIEAASTIDHFILQNGYGTINGGGAIYNNGNGVTNLKNSSFLNNSILGYGIGGAIYNFAGTVAIENCTFKNNSQVGIGIYGGAIYNKSQMSIANSTFIENSAGRGGGIANYGTLTVTNSTLSTNSAEHGGGIANYGTLTVTSSNVSGNSASVLSGSGGGILNDGNGIVTVTDSTISNNSGPNGGGIFNLSSTGTVNIFGSTLSGNTVSGNGGGVSNWGTLNVTNSTFFGNSAAFGGGVFNLGVLTLKNGTFSGNAAVTHGGGIINYGTLNYANTILANSTTGSDCYNENGVVSTNTNNLVENNSALPNHCGAPGLNSDPMLESLANNGSSTKTMALLPGSPAINAGSDSVCATAPVNNTSQNGVSRPSGIHCDIGAFEFDTSNTPLISIKGNNLIISNGDTSPSTTDYTDFGNTDSSTGSVDRVFVVENIGGSVLHLTGAPIISISGANAVDFSVNTLPPGSITSGSSAEFTVHFDPSTVGLRTATISISNDDAGANPYVFSIQGTGVDFVPTVLQSERMSPDPTAATSVEYKVTFSEAVTGVDAGDFYLTTSGVAGAGVSTVTGSGSSYTVKVNTGSGN
ncbi:MAG TPA: choice-of-anchor Q domain-containing protein, partial [Anaerolineales bacterium]|nr:choice-of-anchor Q domain-containing protein [Anaerolineales bacterium]